MTIAAEKRNAIRDWFIGHGDWATAMIVMITCFIFCFREAMTVNHRLDDHITAINKRCDEINKELNKRTDDLMVSCNQQFNEMHKQFYDLLKDVHRNDYKYNQQRSISTHDPQVSRRCETFSDGINPGMD